jgi:hypothetical protein
VVWGKDRDELVTRQDIHDLKNHYNKDSWTEEQRITNYEYDLYEHTEGQKRKQLVEKLKTILYPGENNRTPEIVDESSLLDIVSFDGSNGLLDFLEKLIKQERRAEKERTLHDVVHGEVVEVSEGTVTLSCSSPRFEEGDVIGYIRTDEQVEPIGSVLGGGDILTVSLQKPLIFEQGHDYP